MTFIALFGIWLRLFERDYPGTRFDEIWNGGWIIIETMTTIGYGEIVPQTHLGRFTAICACVLGNFLLSLIVLALSNTISLNADEDGAFSSVKKKYTRERNHRLDSVILLQRFARLTHARKQGMPLRVPLVRAFNEWLSHFSKLTLKLNGEKDLQEIIDEVMASEENCMNMIADCDFKVLRSIKGLTAEINNFSGTSHARATNIENLCTKMLNISYAMANCRVRRVNGLQQISEKSILDKLLRKRGKQLIIEKPKKATEVPLDSNLERYRRRGRLMTQTIAIKVTKKSNGSSENGTRKGSDQPHMLTQFFSMDNIVGHNVVTYPKAPDSFIQEEEQLSDSRVMVSRNEKREPSPKKTEETKFGETKFAESPDISPSRLEDRDSNVHDQSIEFRMSRLEFTPDESEPLTGRIDIKDDKVEWHSKSFENP
mmetsp:Transcript_21521/g.39361  ORF Transcript_21521/g.39361 Transcript_21521/m.39361 type:complete len:428 (+) Transcript_21521:115-1398(+)